MVTEDLHIDARLELGEARGREVLESVGGVRLLEIRAQRLRAHVLGVRVLRLDERLDRRDALLDVVVVVGVLVRQHLGERVVVLVEDRRPHSRLVYGHTHTHSVLTTPGLHLRSFVPLRRGFAKTVLQRRGFALHPQPGLIVIVGVGAAGQDFCLNKVLTVHFCRALEQLVSGH